MWLVLELWPDLDHASLCMNEDGTTMVFSEYEDAENERANCQEGLIVPVGEDVHGPNVNHERQS